MAKKNTPAPLQAEVNNDEEWTKFLERPGLLVVDVYCEWSGPCSGMVSLLKKVKMEIGGDSLNYATAKSDFITDLERFRGKCEPTWMFIHNGQMVNLMFGAHCPELQTMLIQELRKVQNNEPHEFALPVTEKSPEEEKRIKILDEERTAKETAKRAKEEANVRAMYEAEMAHYTNALQEETLLMLYPWVFKDEEGHKRDKFSSPPYLELVENLLLGKYSVAQELRKRLDEDILSKLFAESDWTVDENTAKLMMDGKAMFMRLKDTKRNPYNETEPELLEILFGEPRLPAVEEKISEESFAGRHHPAFPVEEFYPVVWAPPNSRSKVTVFRIIFRKYVETTFPYEDKTEKPPIILFKYDNRSRNDLRMVLEMYASEVVNFGIFERDKPPEAKIIATSIDELDEKYPEKTGFEAFICVVKKVGSEAFLAFAGIGPNHVSENPEVAIEETNLYFPEDTIDEGQSDEEDKPEEGETPDVDPELADKTPPE